MMPVFGIYLFGPIWSSLYITLPVANTGIVDKCGHIPSTLNTVNCETLMKWKEARPYDSKCIDDLIKSRDDYVGSAHMAFTSLTHQYCGGLATGCTDCFYAAFGDIWNQNICLTYNKYNMEKVKACLKQYDNEDFIWSRKIILGQQNETVDLSSDEYQICEKEFSAAVLPKYKITFPVYLKFTPEIHDTYFTVLLSLFLDALRLKKYDLSTRVTCQHFLDINIFENFKELSEVKIKEVPTKVKDSYVKMRGNICSGAADVGLCSACFQEADHLFTFHLYNQDLKLSSVRADFRTIDGKLNDCFNNHVMPKKYSSIKNYIKKHKLWFADFGKCWEVTSEENKDQIEENEKTISGVGKNVFVMKSVAFNYFTFYFYYKREGESVDCEVIRNSHILCVAAKTIKSANIYASGAQDEDNQMTYLAIEMTKCGE